MCAKVGGRGQDSVMCEGALSVDRSAPDDESRCSPLSFHFSLQLSFPLSWNNTVVLMCAKVGGRGQDSVMCEGALSVDRSAPDDESRCSPLSFHFSLQLSFPLSWNNTVVLEVL
jgi:hypothetical protein